MSHLLDRIQQDLKEAMRGQDRLRTSTLRLLLNDLKNAGLEKRARKGFTEEVDSPAEYLSSDEILQVLRSAVKRRRESAEQYRAGGREELAAREEAEAALLEAYLPRAMDPAELETLVRETVQRLGAEGPRDLGRVMKEILPRVGQAADGKTVSEMVRRILGEGR